MQPIRNLLFSRRQILSLLSALAVTDITKVFADAPPQKATFVLVQGAWHGGWCWKKIIPLLRAAGHEVYTPTMTGLGERLHLLTPQINLDTHVQDITNLLEYEDLQNVTLIGHSYGGMVITGVADKAGKRVKQLVYLDAFLPENGKSLQDYAPGVPFEKIAKKNGEGWKVPMPVTVEGFGVKDKEDITWMSSRVGAQPLKTFTQPLKFSAPLNTLIKKVYIQLTDNSAWFNEAAERARRQGFLYYKMLAGGHEAMVTKPKELAQIFNALV